ncbi:hypothetical protein PACTADRAFT_51208 [Pachysolen tannophilus NRRL Y-2460]|uniref:Cation/H+ exchanger domain-containing protein n=1 Tax=Pachysolen tannophilus NRRL Y-2460 TaxID=669874 RepID=A0A1E4TRJ6_PACTA|nr:hypothetical protein PACTADRAFT_51208 [Pachysolen tannophilus NRRL Y-2460]
MAVWEQLSVDKAHVAYAIIGFFATLFAIVSLFLKEKLFIGEATVSTVVGIITGPKVLNWFSPSSWTSNSKYLTQEVSRIILIIQLFAVSVELPKKYLKHHFRSVALCLFFAMTFGWLITALFIFIIFNKNLNFNDALLISACITATDPVLAAAIVGKGKFGQRIPAHIRNLLSAESGANDGMAFPFVLLSTNLVVRYGHPGEIIKDWICVSILYEVVFGILLGCIIGIVGRKLIKFCEKKNLIDRESFLCFYILLSLMCTGFGSILGVDDLLVSFAAGTAFAWDGWFQRQTEESNLSNIIDILLNMVYFLYFGSIVPWDYFNDASLNLEIWRLILLGIVVIFLRRIPIFLMLKPFTPDLRTWKEAFFCGHFGPIGVGAVFCSMVATSSVEKIYLKTQTILPVGSIDNDVSSTIPHSYLLTVLWPIVSFLVMTSIIIHGSSVTAMVLCSNVKKMNFTIRNPQESSSSSEDEEESERQVSVPNQETHGERKDHNNKLTKRINNNTMHLTSFASSSKNDAKPSEEIELEAIPITYDENGKIRKPEVVFIQGNHSIVEDNNGEVIDEFIYNHHHNNQQDQRNHDYDDDSPTFRQKIYKFFTRTDSFPNYNINIDEKNKKQNPSLSFDKQTLNVYQVNNEIYIENDDGKIIRKYIIDEQDKANQDIETGQSSSLRPTRNAFNNHNNSEFDEAEIREKLNKVITSKSN